MKRQYQSAITAVAADNAYSHGRSAYAVRAQARVLLSAWMCHRMFVATQGDKHRHA
ncbi:hypothetical protein XHV734_2108 [Xanthomonas hortorum pv. vitians]|nr:hypothetical protein XHV734_2108 [Xanthomonas hortorum pv. vitians]